MIYRFAWGVFAPLLVAGYGWVCFQFILPFLKAQDSVLYEPIGYILLILFSGFAGLLVVFGHRFCEVVLLRAPKFPKKLVRNCFVVGAITGLLVSHLTYFLIIQPEEMIKCSSQSGYKNNLMTQYVTNLDFCDK
ncbi:hypothetical protein L1D54_07270 [Vibrio brasiliensis]|uniref:hypothetical protein n=1 Tax=Vibrio brasiliensis TaxID=170652 RepID=UPI001EFD172D|nr:hypothetical protein [Vibrio brasiliensis]MCG9750275.1 hypothetical protein [Vibrio brasiliensis]MCG9785498.1 hypothetical protein [Vibrio brasiliensis]